LVSGLRALGHDPDPLLAAVGASPRALADPDARIPMSAGAGFLARAEAATGDNCIGLHIAEHADLRSVDVHFYAMTASATLRDAFDRLSRYQRLIHESTRVDLVPVGNGVALRHLLPGGLSAPRHTAEFLLAAWLRTGRLITATDWNPSEVRFAHVAPSSTGEIERFFRAPVLFATGENALVVPDDALVLPCIGADPALASFMDRYAHDHMPPGAPVEGVSDRVRSVVSAQLREGVANAAVTAGLLKMSVRTLNRTLAAEGTSYRVILDQLRHELATRHLADSRTSIGEVAFLLGFSELSAFYRAFKRWTGQTPADYRAQVHAGPTSRRTPRRRR
jgi:AraC-like DNA-binding protein